MVSSELFSSEHPHARGPHHGHRPPEEAAALRQDGHLRGQRRQGRLHLQGRGRLGRGEAQGRGQGNAGTHKR